MRLQLGLKRTRQQAHTVDSIREVMIELRVLYPAAGAREMVNLLFHEKGMSVSRCVHCHIHVIISLRSIYRLLVVKYFRQCEPDLVRERKAGRLKRRRFWAAGVNDILAVDQHDKWKKFGLALHTGVDPFCGLIHWNKVWWTNSDPKLIFSYYLEMARKTGCTFILMASLPLHY